MGRKKEMTELRLLLNTDSRLQSKKFLNAKSLSQKSEPFKKKKMFLKKKRGNNAMTIFHPLRK